MAQNIGNVHSVAVAKPAPPDSQLKPIDYTSATGARFDNYGNIIPHSILGSVEEFKKQALKHGDLPEVSNLPIITLDIFYVLILVSTPICRLTCNYLKNQECLSVEGPPPTC